MKTNQQTIKEFNDAVNEIKSELAPIVNSRMAKIVAIISGILAITLIIITEF